MNYKIAKFAVDHLPQPVIMAGGISPDNSDEIIDTVHPYGVDVTSGVESAPGIKDHRLIERLFVAISERA
jgi:phosphoribosylanthranilate isomerase